MPQPWSLHIHQVKLKTPGAAWAHSNKSARIENTLSIKRHVFCNYVTHTHTTVKSPDTHSRKLLEACLMAFFTEILRRIPPPPSPELLRLIPNLEIPRPFSPLLLRRRIWTNYLHMCLKEPHGKGAKKNILLTKHKHWLHQTSRAACCDALHMLTCHWQPFASTVVAVELLIFL